MSVPACGSMPNATLLRNIQQPNPSTVQPKTDVKAEPQQLPSEIAIPAFYKNHCSRRKKAPSSDSIPSNSSNPSRPTIRSQKTGTLPFSKTYNRFPNQAHVNTAPIIPKVKALAKEVSTLSIPIQASLIAGTKQAGPSSSEFRSFDKKAASGLVGHNEKLGLAQHTTKLISNHQARKTDANNKTAESSASNDMTATENSSAGRLRDENNQHHSTWNSDLWTVSWLCPGLLAFRPCFCAPNPCIISRSCASGGKSKETTKRETVPLKLNNENGAFPNVSSKKSKKKNKNKQNRNNRQKEQKHNEATTPTSFTTSIVRITPPSEFPPLVSPFHQGPSNVDNHANTTVTKNYAAILSQGSDKPRTRKAMPPVSKNEPWDAEELRLCMEQNLSYSTQEKCASHPQIKQRRAICNGSMKIQKSEDWHFFSMLPTELQTLIWQWAILIRSSTVYVRYFPNQNPSLPGSIRYLKV